MTTFFGHAIPHYIPVVFHNLSGYNAHLFIRELGKKFDSGSVGVIAENPKKYIGFNSKVIEHERKMPLGEIKLITRECN